MMLRRMCELKKSGKAWVPGDIRKEYAAAGEQRELLEIALLEAIQQLGEEQSKKHAAVKDRPASSSALLCYRREWVVAARRRSSIASRM